MNWALQPRVMYACIHGNGSEVEAQASNIRHQLKLKASPMIDHNSSCLAEGEGWQLGAK